MEHQKRNIEHRLNKGEANAGAGGQIGEHQSNKKQLRFNRKMTKVKDLLRESRENAHHMNKVDLEKMFNMQIG